MTSETARRRRVVRRNWAEVTRDRLVAATWSAKTQTPPEIEAVLNWLEAEARAAARSGEPT